MFDLLDKGVLFDVTDALPSIHQFTPLSSAIGHALPEDGSFNDVGSLYEGFAGDQPPSEGKMSGYGRDSVLKSGRATVDAASSDSVTGLKWDGRLLSGNQSSDSIKQRRTPEFLSAFWGLDDGIQIQGAPAATALDGMPITFSWLINPA